MKKKDLQYELQIKQLERSYIQFMGIENFPKYNLELYEIRVDETDQKGFGAIAQAMYDPKSGKHTLRICKNLELKKYVVFHEFTHILDSEMYAKRDSLRYAYLSGYTEYHASQVELMVLLGAQSHLDIVTDKTINSVISTFPSEKTVLDYLLTKHQFVVDMMQRRGFPESIEALKTTLGALYNYWGLRSICKMYLKDYVEKVDNSAIIDILPSQLFSVMNSFMDGWFDASKVEMSFGPYSNALIPILKERKLLE